MQVRLMARRAALWSAPIAATVTAAAVAYPAAEDHVYRARVDSELELLGLARKGWIVGLGGGPVGASGLISNCPLVMSF